jgi:hypothetical protein
MLDVLDLGLGLDVVLLKLREARGVPLVGGLGITELFGEFVVTTFEVDAGLALLPNTDEHRREGHKTHADTHDRQYDWQFHV